MLTVKAYAKINLALDILGKRHDGFHEVAMIMQTIDLADTVQLSEQDGDITVTANIPALACDSTNLAYRAAQMIRQEYGIKSGVIIGLDKKIPMAAGLAGGSADAAGVLVGLNRLWSLDISNERLAQLGAALGSDVPFCLSGGTMLATGRGEILKRIPSFSECYVVLAKPNISIATAWAYGSFRQEQVSQRPDINGMIDALAAGDFAGVASKLCNVFESVAIPEYAIIGRIKQSMIDSGLIASLMSGSGPTVFGVTQNARQAEAAALSLKQFTNVEVFVAKTVSRVGDHIGTKIITD